MTIVAKTSQKRIDHFWQAKGLIGPGTFARAVPLNRIKNKIRIIQHFSSVKGQKDCMMVDYLA
jgi:hypothetical protein